MTPSDAELLDLLYGRMSAEAERVLIERIENDEVLRLRLAQLSGEPLMTGNINKALFTRQAEQEDIRQAAVAVAAKVRISSSATVSPLPATASVVEPVSLMGFHLFERLARGGMGTVYRARDTSLQRDVAIKILHGVAMVDPLLRERFQREARAMAEIRHPHVLAVHQVVNEADASYLVMHLAEGGSLQDKLDLQSGEPLANEEILRIAVAVTDALVTVHAHGLVHRDIKPSNILLGVTEEEIWLADFGLVHDGQQLSLTGTNMLMGTPQFMSPEQAAGKEADQRSDLFSLGAMLHTLATGRLPFNQTDIDEMRRAVKENQPPSLREVAPQLPAWLRHLIESLMIKDPARRPASAQVVLDLLLREVDPGSVPTRLLQGRATRRRKLWRRVAMIAVSLVVVSLGSFVVLEKTGRTHYLNTFLASHRGHTLWISGQWGSYANLESAVIAANLRSKPSEILIHSRATLRYRQLTISNPLTIRATKGNAPVLLADELSGVKPDQPHIKVLAPLTLINLTLHQRPISFQLRPLFLVNNNQLTLQQCRMVRSSRFYKPGQDVNFGLIQAHGTTEIHLVNSEVYSFGVPFITLHDGKVSSTNHPHIHIDGSVILGRFIALRGQQVQATLNMRHSFVGGVFHIEHYAAKSRLNVKVEDCVLHTTQSLVYRITTIDADGSAWLHWHGRNNLIINTGIYLRTPAPATDLQTFAQWQQFLEQNGGSEQGSLIRNEDPDFLKQGIQDDKIFAGGSYDLSIPQEVHHPLPPLPSAEIIGPRRE